MRRLSPPLALESKVRGRGAADWRNKTIAPYKCARIRQPRGRGMAPRPPNADPLLSDVADRPARPMKLGFASLCIARENFVKIPPTIQHADYFSDIVHDAIEYDVGIC